MRLKLRYAGLDKDITQKTQHYVSSDSFQMVMGDGCITVLDPIDDMMMFHSVEWEGEGDETDHREAWVLRWLGMTHDYFVNNCRIRRTKEMMTGGLRVLNEENTKLEHDMFSR